MSIVYSFLEYHPSKVSQRSVNLSNHASGRWAADQIEPGRRQLFLVETEKQDPQHWYGEVSAESIFTSLTNLTHTQVVKAPQV